MWVSTHYHKTVLQQAFYSNSTVEVCSRTNSHHRHSYPLLALQIQTSRVWQEKGGVSLKESREAASEKSGEIGLFFVVFEPQYFDLCMIEMLGIPIRLN